MFFFSVSSCFRKHLEDIWIFSDLAAVLTFLRKNTKHSYWSNLIAITTVCHTPAPVSSCNTLLLERHFNKCASHIMGFCHVQQSRTACTTPHQPLQAGPSPPLSSHSAFMAANGAEGVRGQQALSRFTPCCQSRCLGPNIGSFCSGKQQVIPKEANIFAPHVAASGCSSLPSWGVYCHRRWG